MFHATRGLHGSLSAEHPLGPRGHCPGLLSTPHWQGLRSSSLPGSRPLGGSSMRGQQSPSSLATFMGAVDRWLLSPRRGGQPPTESPGQSSVQGLSCCWAALVSTGAAAHLPTGARGPRVPVDKTPPQSWGVGVGPRRSSAMGHWWKEPGKERGPPSAAEPSTGLLAPRAGHLPLPGRVRPT